MSGNRAAEEEQRRRVERVLALIHEEKKARDAAWELAQIAAMIPTPQNRTRLANAEQKALDLRRVGLAAYADACRPDGAR